MIIKDLLYQISVRSVRGNQEEEVNFLHTDSRTVLPGSAFVALRGTQVDGHTYIEQALAQGASLIVAETEPPIDGRNTPWIVVSNSAVALAEMAANFYGHPARQLTIVGVTGTNGKTTVATLLYKLFDSLGYRCGLLSTVENQIAGQVFEATHTTPDAIQLHGLLRRMVDARCTHVFMEVSSHALHQHRVHGLSFRGGIFTNITHDHLDYHQTFEEYIRVKKSLFDGLSGSSFALSNADDKRGGVMLQNTSAHASYYAFRTVADFKGKVLENGLDGLLLSIDQVDVHFRLVGEFNAYNLLAVYGAACLLGVDKQEVLTRLSQLTGATGRFDCYRSPKTGVLGIIDYAHTPDALQNVLSTIGRLRQGSQRVITVVGCGGNRDASKRPIMAAVACALSDQAIFTSDNPRFEDPKQILADMERELTPTDRRKCLSILDRREAIKAAVQLTAPNDIMLVAGKGHEPYQEVAGRREPFDDKKMMLEFFELLEK
ncbi:MAG: UDP-N-acetylmuramoyl-L-alanyl-D-glutamate--2,6-diaminopimelate ligase [Bacteroidetes bacterium]|nr:UDP-N-acetylmuramoyl-L-alanyl-D-glutamate--2,6-diaminopimelate ligase [Bacteroidota bacterium]